MVKDFLISFSDNFKEKTKNPFLGTYLLVWLIRNWDLIYSLFNFDPKSNRGERIRFVKAYYSETNFIENLLINILWSFGLLILTYALVNISRVIVNLSEKQLTPWIYKITDSKSIVLREEYDRVRSENDDLQERLDKERESKSRLEARIKTLENEIVEISKVKMEATPIKPDVTAFGGESKTYELIKRLKDADKVADFLRLSLTIQRGEQISTEEEGLDLILELGLFIFKGHQSSYAKYYALTKNGEKVLEKLRQEK